MKPVMQTKFTTEDMTVHGNCHAACIASILELPLEDVPALEDMGHEWSNALSIFLIERGYCWHGTFWATDDPDWWQHLTERCKGVDGFYMVWGGSPRAHVKRGHSVVYQDGAMVHDPHPDGAGLRGVKSVLMIERAKPTP